MRGKRFIPLVAAIALLIPAPGRATMADVNLGSMRIIDPDGIITECAMSASNGTVSGAPKATSKIVCTRPVVGLYTDINIHRHSAPAGVYGNFDSDQCSFCTQVTASTVATCYGGCPSGWSWKGFYGAHILYVVDFNLGSAVYPPPGADCHLEYTRMWCTYEHLFFV